MPIPNRDDLANMNIPMLISILVSARMISASFPLANIRPDRSAPAMGPGTTEMEKLLTPSKNDRFYDGLAGGIREPLKFGEDVLLVPREVTDDTRIAKQLSDVSVGEYEIEMIIPYDFSASLNSRCKLTARTIDPVMIIPACTR
jgi:hypothetical protein